MSNLQRRLVMANLPPAMPPPGRGIPSSGMKKGFSKGKPDYSPVSWDHYFEKMSDILVDSDTFRVYESGTSGPVCLCLHGGGFSALSWAVLSKILTSHVSCRCTAIDLRGHGDSTTQDDTNLSAEVMANDVERVVNKMYGDSPPPIVLVGHSMGGAVAVHTACRNRLPSLVGLVVIDVVEGTALEALTGMQIFLRGRPKVFPSIEKAIEYSVRSGQIHNIDSARVSMVGQLKRVETNETATAEIEHQHHDLNEAVPADGASSAIREEDESEMAATAGSAPQQAVIRSSTTKQAQSNSQVTYSWRIDLSATEKYWRGWFEGLSKSFLSCSAPKVLVLAGVDRLDKELTVGQMQGKFQLQLLPQSGHAVHEDFPEKVADALATFLVRYRLTVAREEFTSTFPGS